MSRGTTSDNLMGNVSLEKDQFNDIEELNKDELAKVIPLLIYLPLIGIFGLIGNSLVLIVYRPRRKLSNSKFFIISLSAIDLFSCFFAVPIEIAVNLKQTNFEQTELCKTSRFLNIFGICSSSFILLFISIDRFRKICRPFGRQINFSIAKVLVMLSLTFGLLLAWPAVFIYGKKEIEIPNSNINGTSCDVTAENIFDNSSQALLIYALVFGLLFTFGIIVICVMYCCVWYVIRKQKIKGKRREIAELSPHDSISFENSVLHSDEIGTSTEDGNTKRKSHPVKEISETKHLETGNGNNSSDTDRTTDKSDEIFESQCSSSKAAGNEQACHNNSKHNPDMTIVMSQVTVSMRGNQTRAHRSFLKPSKQSFYKVGAERCVGSKSIYLTSRKHANTRKTTVVMFMITVTTIITFVPHLSLVAMRNVNRNFVFQLSDLQRAVYKFFDKSFFLNCAINPIIYNFCDSRFRYTVKQLFSKTFAKIRR